MLLLSPRALVLSPRALVAAISPTAAPSGALSVVLHTAHPSLSLSPLASTLLRVGRGNEGMLQGPILHGPLQVVMHGACLREEALNAGRRCG